MSTSLQRAGTIATLTLSLAGLFGCASNADQDVFTSGPNTVTGYSPDCPSGKSESTFTPTGRTENGVHIINVQERCID